MAQRKVPLRMCLGCREMKPKIELLRLVKTAAGTLVYDPSSKQNGRGAYLCHRQECLDKVLKNKSFSKALQADMTADIVETLKEKLETL